MKNNRKKLFSLISGMILTVAAMAATNARADDTDIYKPKVKHNVVIMLDTSGSMNFGVYDNDVSYHDFYKDICANHTGYKNAHDAIAGGYGTSAYFYPDSRAMDRNQIYLLYGNIGYSNGMTGDAGNPDYVWWTSSLAATHTYLSADGELVDVNGKHPGESGYLGRLATVVDSSTGKTMVTLDGQRLPNNQDAPMHNWQANPDNSKVDKGFSGMLRAPGYYFSGYFYKSSGGDKNKAVTDSGSSYTSNQASAGTYDGKEKDYFFITGNWMNMQMVYNLDVQKTNNKWIRAWSACKFAASNYTPIVNYSLTSKEYPNDYAPNYDSQLDGTVNYIIYNGESGAMRLHFDDFVLATGDMIQLYDEYGNKSGADITTIPADGWTPWVTGRKIILRFITDNDADTVAKGWSVNAYQYQSSSDYTFFSRLEAGTSAIIDVIESTRGKINWGIMKFDGCDGAKAVAPLNPSLNDDQQKQNIINALNNAVASGGTPLGEALQDVFQYFHDKTTQIHHNCNKNFVITLTDGYPSCDDDWNRLDSNVDFTLAANHDTTQFTEDPFQYSSPPDDYYDDVAAYAYSHSYVDWSDIDKDDRNGSPDNVMVHNIGFSIDAPVLKHASEVGGGIFLTAFSKSQLVNAFYSLGLLIADYTSYTAPVVSVDESNRVQSGNELFMALFKPNEDQLWTGNLKRYGLAYGVMTGCSGDNQWYVSDSSGSPVTECDGSIIHETTSIWSSEQDGGEVEKGGAGKTLYNSIPPLIGKLTQTNIQNSGSFRKIYTCDSSNNLIQVATDTITNADLGVSSDEDRYKIINYIYGYTYDAYTAAAALAKGGVAEEGSPVQKSSWPLGPIIHSSPKIIDYLTSAGLQKRYIAVGSNDGMLHVFDDTDGKEVFAFIPPAVLTKFKEFDPALDNQKVYTVDGAPILVTNSAGDNLLVFGLRRGGRAYYALNIDASGTIPSLADPWNVSNWSVEWKIDNNTPGMNELGLTFATPEPSRIKTGTTTVSGQTVDVYRNILIIPGGYDPVEDKSDPDEDYSLTTDHVDTMGRGIFIIDVDTGLPLTSGNGFNTDVSLPTGYHQFVWPHLGDADSNSIDDGEEWITSNSTSIMAQMKYCFPASPTVVNGNDGYLGAAYFADLYGQIWKLRYVYDESTSPPAGKFYLDIIFKANPITNQKSAYELLSDFTSWSEGDPDPRGTMAFDSDFLTSKDAVKNPRKTFYSPTVSYAGNCYTDLPVLYMGTGDRAHPTFRGGDTSSNYSPISNGIYCFYDAQAYVENVLGRTYQNPSSSNPDDLNTGYLNDCFSEFKLLNTTCGALEDDVDLFPAITNTADNATANDNAKTAISSYMQEHLMGWYELLYYDFNHLCYSPDNTGEADHLGEKVISPLTLFGKVIYATSYQPIRPASTTDPCVYEGNARLYGLDYCSGNSAFNGYSGNDVTTTTTNPVTGETTTSTEKKRTRRDRSQLIGTSIPSSISIIIRNGHTAGFISSGTKIAAPVTPPTDEGMIPYYWREIF